MTPPDRERRDWRGILIVARFILMGLLCVAALVALATGHFGLSVQSIAIAGMVLLDLMENA